MHPGRVVMGLWFFPRGGSAYVVRYLGAALAERGWQVSVAAGSLGEPGEGTHAPTFFAGLDVHVLDATAAVRAADLGRDPLAAVAARAPIHPSYEDRADAPDIVLAAVPPTLHSHLAAVWEPVLRAAGADVAEVFHLHHLSPQLDVVCRAWPDVPRVVHLHGTEMNLVESIDARAALAAEMGRSLATMPADPADLGDEARTLDDERRALLRHTRWDVWRHGEYWATHLRAQAQQADHIIAVSPDTNERAITLLGVPADRVTTVPNGVDLERFAPRPRTPGSRRVVFRRVLVDDPRGWTETGPPGTLAYTEGDLDRLLGPGEQATVLLFVGRFLHFKRVPSLVRAFARARTRFTRPASLVIWGGHPGEWEGEHPATVAEREGSDGIFFAGWRGHEDLPAGLAASDVLVVPSVDDAYPQVPLEAMAVGLPVLACDSGGLRSMVNLDPARPTGWLVPPDDVDALADALVRVVARPEEVAVRGANALDHARAELSWSGIAPRFEAVYDAAAHRRAARI